MSAAFLSVVGTDLGLQAEHVRSVVEEHDYVGPEAFDLDQLLGHTQAGPRHVLMLTAGMRTTALVTSSKLQMQHYTHVCDAPPQLWSKGTAPLINRVALSDEARPLLVLDCNALAQRAVVTRESRPNEQE